ncbi:hypothetical protein HYFRA_00007879 [Hymenoscyphus fraxineus]|uniref:FAD-binding domain-containing protein n=1 Tax=Hymenoscyphus fraxineus TaxID=746836 RepID=A0A9N9KL09_9HELO|nr:hypothetical protein HYFRA_00007879 [Hymenoscyphus fraxineus]
MAIEKKPFHVAVVGGGIGGLCLVIGLLRQGVSVTLYEAAPEFKEIGAGIGFGPNALRALEQIDPSLRASYETIQTSNPSPNRKSTWFQFQLGMKSQNWSKLQASTNPTEKITETWQDGQKVATVTAGQTGQLSFHRAHFLDILVALVPKDVPKFGKKLVDIEELEGGKLELKFADGTTAQADAVVGCDGVKSRTRALLLGPDHPAVSPRFTGKYAYRGLIPMEQAVEALGDEVARNSQLYMGHHGHVLTFPIEKGKTMNVVAFRSKEGEWGDEKWVLPMERWVMLRDYEGWGENVMKILSVSCDFSLFRYKFERSKIIKRRKNSECKENAYQLIYIQMIKRPDVWGLFDHPHAPTYYRKRFAILGDAAHASTPHQGAGAGQAVEDAFILSRLMGKISSVDEIEKAFKAYDAIRRPRSQKVVETSRDAAAVYEFEDDSLGTDLEKVRARLEIRYKWIWDEDMNEHLRQAMELMD